MQLVAFVVLHVSVDAEPDATLVGDAVNVSVGALGAAIETAADFVMLPPAPEHARVKVFAAVSAPVLAVPDVAFVPVQPPLAVQLVAFVELHVNVELPPLDTLVGETLSVSVGAAGGCWTVTVAVAELDPPVPLQFSEKLALAVSGPTLCEPVVDLLPDQPPDAVHDVAFVADQVKVLLPPLDTLVGLAVSVVTGALGGGAAPTVTAASPLATPPRPTQVSPKFCDVCSGPVVKVPSVAC